MSKEEAIIKSYGEYWEQLPGDAQHQALENNGFIHSKYLEFSNGSLLDCIEFEWMDTYNAEFGEPIQVFRPKSLQGIEDNNGWIKIESEDDLPKENGHFLVCNKISNQIEIDFIDWDYESHLEIWLEFNSHYQPIEKPKPPVY